MKKLFLTVLLIGIAMGTLDRVCNPACGYGDRCDNGRCVGFGGSGDNWGGHGGGRCRSDSQCSFPKKCLNQICQILPINPCQNCRSNEKCIFNKCVPNTQTCVPACRPGWICDSGRCKVAPCNCLPGQKCLNGKCYNSDYCWTDSNCQAFGQKICINNKCVSPIDSCPRPCPFGTRCQRGVCISILPPIGFCTYDSQCKNWERCLKNKCVPKQNYCVPACQPGWTCNNGVCKPIPCNCGPRQVCRLGVCYPQGYCWSNSDCPISTVCSGNKCVAIAPVCPLPCPLYHICRNGACVKLVPPVGQCYFDENCKPWQRCLNKICVRFERPCVPACFPGYECRDGQCVYEHPPPLGCIRDIDCGPNYRCVAPNCIPLVTFQCSTDSQCSWPKKCISGWCKTGCRQNCRYGQKCFNGNCVPEQYCLSNSDCPGAAQCYNNRCFVVVVNPPGPVCTMNRQCPRGQRCENGYCVLKDMSCKKRCRPGYKCIDGKCIPRRRRQQNDQDEQCKRDRDCKPWQKCQRGDCVVNYGTCSPCGSGHYCSSGVCNAIPFDTCSTNYDCQNWETCRHGACYDD